ncbi:hypothetical protein MOMA_07526 [Moraxella macacae 0408225]|uniref:SCP2 domain-containing protein n=1 Tax=Moraxella macacae 0408225 TaxID=1230338 RepID=L2F7F5_9GAMM|nr:hypothetical protein [Moraxella macacae]ELA08393.1 hypothetical protein MOMA_07526 [Moraxella macacae 0408225]
MNVSDDLTKDSQNRNQIESNQTDNQIPPISQIGNNRTQNPQINQQTLSKTALDVVLVLLETLLALLLRFDANLRQVVYPLAQQNLVLCVRSYVPHVTIYATFTVNGVLLDSELRPNQQIHVTINGFSFQVLQALFGNKTSVLKQLQFRGEADDVANVKAFFAAVAISNVVQEIVAKFTDKSGEKSEKPKKNLEKYQQKIDEQKQEINTLTIKVAETSTALLEAKSQNKILKIVLLVAVLVIVVLAIVIMR